MRYGEVWFGLAGKASYGELCSGTSAARCGMEWQVRLVSVWTGKTRLGMVRQGRCGMVLYGELRQVIVR